ncbi:hypothetical protein SAY87_031201 [Trapa incisa]|uniref:Uncharacterized protein n=2 Tax=Trapa TaxID=22665 RepID=A0AAN7LKI2_TRANT|nr:hypothetical protein SAY87_031201 [Trapa incisa]KAK4787200.1 hypothetical protein SAY86_011033 [Trapa natans]
MGRGNTDLWLRGRLPFLLLISSFIIISVHLAGCRSITARTEVSVKSSTAEFFSRFEHQFPANFHGTRNQEIGAETDPMYGVSERTTPGGPDPLHN